MMTNNEIFDKVEAHLLAQNRKSSIGDPESEEPLFPCAYYGEDGTRCAVGCLMDSESYNCGLEGHSVGDEIVRAVLLECGVNADDSGTLDMLSMLQEIHDSCLPQHWKESLWMARIKLEEKKILKPIQTPSAP